MDEEKLHYIEETALVWERAGLTRMAGRIIGYLSICDEDAVSFDQIRDVLNASKGSISTNIKQLENTGFIEKVSLPADRKTYYRISKMNISGIMKARNQLIGEFVDIFSRGRKLKNRKDDVAEWLLETSFFYMWIEDRLEEMYSRWDKEKDNIIEQYRRKDEELPK